ncbi:TPA: hypothetical protein J1460_004996 [Escherichia coli]|nr:hypothetical protein [Escherichia coli]
MAAAKSMDRATSDAAVVGGAANLVLTDKDGNAITADIYRGGERHLRLPSDRRR